MWILILCSLAFSGPSIPDELPEDSLYFCPEHQSCWWWADLPGEDLLGDFIETCEHRWYPDGTYIGIESCSVEAMDPS